MQATATRHRPPATNLSADLSWTKKKLGFGTDLSTKALNLKETHVDKEVSILKFSSLFLSSSYCNLLEPFRRSSLFRICAGCDLTGCTSKCKCDGGESRGIFAVMVELLLTCSDFLLLLLTSFYF